MLQMINPNYLLLLSVKGVISVRSQNTKVNCQIQSRMGNGTSNLCTSDQMMGTWRREQTNGGHLKAEDRDSQRNFSYNEVVLEAFAEGKINSASLDVSVY